MCLVNSDSRTVQELIHLYNSFQQLQVTENDILNFFRNSLIKEKDLYDLCDKIEKYDINYLDKCKQITNKPIPFLYYKQTKVNINICKEFIKEKINDNSFYDIKDILQKYLDKLESYVLTAHKIHNLNLSEKIKCIKCSKILLLKKNITFFNIKKRLDDDEAYCFNCKNVYKIYYPPDLLENFSLNSTKPYITQIEVDNF